MSDSNTEAAIEIFNERENKPYSCDICQKDVLPKISLWQSFGHKECLVEFQAQLYKAEQHKIKWDILDRLSTQQYGKITKLEKQLSQANEKIRRLEIDKRKTLNDL